jgi:hypothetical protein
LSILWVMDFWCLLYCNRTENRVTLWTVLEVLDSKIWLSFEHKSCSSLNLDVCRIFVCYHRYCGIKGIKKRSNSTAAVWLACTVFCLLSGRNVGSFYLLIVSCALLFWCWKLLIFRWCSFEPCLTLWLNNWRRQVNIASWSTCFHLLFVLSPLNFRIHMIQITW